MIEQPLFETEINLMITPLGLSSPYRLRASSRYRWSEATVSGPWQLIVQSAVWHPETGGPPLSVLPLSAAATFSTGLDVRCESTQQLPSGGTSLLPLTLTEQQKQG